MIFIKMYHFDPYNVFLAIATNISQRLKIGLEDVSLNMKQLGMIGSLKEAGG